MLLLVKNGFFLVRTATFFDSLLCCGLAETTMEKHGEASAERMTLGKDDWPLNMGLMDMITSGEM